MFRDEVTGQLKFASYHRVASSRNTEHEYLFVDTWSLYYRYDIVSVTAICTAAQLIFPFCSYPTCCVASLRAGPVGCILYNMVIVDAPLFTLGVVSGV